MEPIQIVTPLIILLATGIVAVIVMDRVGFSPIVGYLAAGVCIGPHAFGLIDESATIHFISELGVVFLLFDIGVHFSLSSIWEARRDIFIFGPLQIGFCGVIFGGLSLLLGIPSGIAVILGCTFALSSTAIVVQTLAESGKQNCPVGKTSTAILIFQDICAIFILILATSMTSGESGADQSSLVLSVILALVKAAVAFSIAVILGRYVVNPLFRLLSKTNNEEVFTATALLTVFVTATATATTVLSPTLGAFLGGMMISETPYRHVIKTEIKPFRNLLLGFFFITVGMSLNWHVLVVHWKAIILFVSVFMLIKALMITLTAKLLGWSTGGGIQIGFLLAQGSEFVFAIIAIPVIRGALGEDWTGVVITGIALSLALTPSFADIGGRLARKLQQSTPSKDQEELATADRSPVLVFGLDTVGRMVVNGLEAHNIAYDAIEIDHDRFISASADGYPVAYGDPGDVRLMESLSFGNRDIVVVTIARYEVAKALLPIMRERYPDLTRLIAVDSEDDKERFTQLAMKPVVNRSIPQGLDLAVEVLRYHGIEEEKIKNWMHRQQELSFVEMELDIHKKHSVAVSV